MDLVDRRLFRFLIDPTWTFPDRPPRPRPFSAKLTSWSSGDRHVGESGESEGDVDHVWPRRTARCVAHGIQREQRKGKEGDQGSIRT